MRKRDAHHRTLAAAAAALTLASLGAACADERTPYDTYLDCHARIVAATSLDEIRRCNTDEQQELLAARSVADPAFWDSWRSELPTPVRLHQEQLQEVEDESILLIVGRTSTDRPASTQVLMRREGARWKIAHEESQAKGAAPKEGYPIEVSLGPAGGDEWTPGELAGAAGQGSDGTCKIGLYHVIWAPNVQITTDCERLTTPGTYSLEELVPEGAELTSSIPVKILDHQNTFITDVERGRLTISEAENGMISGDFQFQASTVSKELTLDGRFTNLPLSLPD